MIRIRYEEINEGTELLSKLKSEAQGVIMIRINLVKSIFSIANEVGLELAKGNGESRQKLQKNVKEALKELGIVFYDEVRIKKHVKKKS